MGCGFGSCDSGLRVAGHIDLGWRLWGWDSAVPRVIKFLVVEFIWHKVMGLGVTEHGVMR